MAVEAKNLLRIGDLYFRGKAKNSSMLIGTWDDPYQEIVKLSDLKILRKFINDLIMDIESTTKQTK